MIRGLAFLGSGIRLQWGLASVELRGAVAGVARLNQRCILEMRCEVLSGAVRGEIHVRT